MQKFILKGRIQMKDGNKDYLCSKCKTGQATYRLDSRTLFCPYMGFHNGNKCSMFKQMIKSDKVERRE